MEPASSRPLVLGETPLNIPLVGLVSRGFGRGSKHLGIPTANLPESVAQEADPLLETGIYYGYAQVDKAAPGHDGVYEMVMSYGWNPYYKNEKRSAVS